VRNISHTHVSRIRNSQCGATVVNIKYFTNRSVFEIEDNTPRCRLMKINEGRKTLLTIAVLTDRSASSLRDLKLWFPLIEPVVQTVEFHVHPAREMLPRLLAFNQI